MGGGHSGVIGTDAVASASQLVGPNPATVGGSGMQQFQMLQQAVVMLQQQVLQLQYENQLLRSQLAQGGAQPVGEIADANAGHMVAARPPMQAAKPANPSIAAKQQRRAK